MKTSSRNLISPLYSQATKTRTLERKKPPPEVPKHIQSKRIFDVLVGLSVGATHEFIEPVFGPYQRPSVFIEIKNLHRYQREYQCLMGDGLTKVFRLR